MEIQIEGAAEELHRARTLFIKVLREAGSSMKLALDVKSARVSEYTGRCILIVRGF